VLVVPHLEVSKSLSFLAIAEAIGISPKMPILKVNEYGKIFRKEIRRLNNLQTKKENIKELRAHI
jgi:hypothetical protein